MNKKLMINILLVSMSILMVGCSSVEVPAETTQAVIESEVASSESSSVGVLTDTEVDTSSAEVLTESEIEPSSVGVLTEVEPSVPEKVQETQAESMAEQSDITAEDKTMYATSSVNVRADSSSDSEKLGSLNLNDSVHVTGSLESGWKQIDFNGVSAYVSSKYLSDTKIEVTAPKKSDTTVKVPTQANVPAPASQPQETATSGNQNSDVAPPAPTAAPSSDNVFDGDFGVMTPEEALSNSKQAAKDAGLIDENGNHIESNDNAWTQ